MSLINIPAYLYFQGVQGNKPVNVQVYTSNYLVNKASLLATNEKESYKTNLDLTFISIGRLIIYDAIKLKINKPK